MPEVWRDDLPTPEEVRAEMCDRGLQIQGEVLAFERPDVDPSYWKGRVRLSYRDGGTSDWWLDMHIRADLGAKWTVQLRWRNLPVVRLDVRGAPHPDEQGRLLSGTHLQWFTGERRLKSAVDAPAPPFFAIQRPDITGGEYLDTLLTFLRVCRIEYWSLTWIHPPEAPTQPQLLAAPR